MIYVISDKSCAAVRADLYNRGIPSLALPSDMIGRLAAHDYAVLPDGAPSVYTDAAVVRQSGIGSLADLFGGCGRLFFDHGDAVLWRQKVYFTAAEKMIIKSLMLENGGALSVRSLAEAAYIRESAVKVHISRINKTALSFCGCRIIEAKTGKGYRLTEYFTDNKNG